MKQKLLTLLSLLCLCVTGAGADDTTLFYDNADFKAQPNLESYTATGGTLTLGNTSGTDKFSSENGSTYVATVPDDMKGYYESKYYIWKSGKSAHYIQLTLSGTETFQAGDIVKICCYRGWNICTDNAGLNVVGNCTATTDSKSNMEVVDCVLPANFEKTNTLYLKRSVGSGTGFAAVKVVRPSNKTVTSTTLTGININGSAWDITGLSNNAATITDEYAGPPTVDFIYVDNYDDNTSSSDKTESIVAEKNGENYKATSTVLEDNVTISFTNVSNVLFSMTEPTGPTTELAKQASENLVATFSAGGSAIVYNGKSQAAVMVDGNGVNLAGSGNSYFKASFTSPLAEGDVIDCSNHDGTFYISNTNDKKNSQTMPYTIESGSNLIGKKAVFVQKNGASTFTWLTITRPKVIETQAFAGIKKGDVTLTEETDYNVSEGVITLTDAHKALLAPTDIKLINHITYDDATEEDKDVDVTFAENGEFFEGTATIGAATYTVKVPVDNTTPLLTLSATAGAINLNSYTPTGTVKVTVTGVNLENGTFNAPTAEGVEVTPATVEITDGSLNQEFTITSTATTAASTELVFAYTGAESKTYTLTYSKTAKRDVAQTDVTEATTWDWSKAGSNSIELKASTSPTNADEFLMAALPEVNNDENFNSQALKVVCQFPTRGSSNYFQGNSVKFNTTVPGKLDVTFSNTGGSRPYRYLRVNGIMTEFKSGDGTMVNATAIAVPAGEVVIDFYIPDATDPQEREQDVVGTTMCRISKIVFTPLSDDNVDVVKVTDVNYATYVTTANIDFTKTVGVKAYKVTSVNPTIQYEEVTEAPTGTPLLIAAESASYILQAADPTYVPAEVTDNLLKAADNTVGDGQTIYVLGKKDDKAVWGLLTSGNTLSAGKAYLVIDGSNNAPFYSIEIGDGETTRINLNANDNLNFDQNAPLYNLSGQRVSDSYKGIVIVNGKKVVIK